MMQRTGIDISSFQGTPDFKRVKADGYEFVLIRAGYGKTQSKAFVPQITAAQAAGMDAGVYWYSYAESTAEAREEAAACLAAIKPYRLPYPVWFDQEYEPQIKALTRQQRTDICKAFLGVITQAGYFTGLYASADWLTNWVDSSQLTAYDKWVAQYAPKVTYPGEYGIWQYGILGTQGRKGTDYTIFGQVDGVMGNCDVDYAYKDYPAIIQNAGLNGYGKPCTGEAEWRMRALAAEEKLAKIQKILSE